MPPDGSRWLLQQFATATVRIFTLRRKSDGDRNSPKETTRLQSRGLTELLLSSPVVGGLFGLGGTNADFANEDHRQGEELTI